MIKRVVKMIELILYYKVLYISNNYYILKIFFTIFGEVYNF